MRKFLKYLNIFIIIVFILPAFLTRTTRQAISYQDDNIEEKNVEENVRK